jgi:hypothetical protein
MADSLDPVSRACNSIKAAHRHAANMVGAKIPCARQGEWLRQPVERQTGLAAVHKRSDAVSGSARIEDLGRVLETALESVLGTVPAAR